MGLSKRERVIRTLEHEEPDMIPIHTLGFEFTGTAYRTFIESDEGKKHKMIIKNNYPRSKNNPVGEITQQRFWHVDCFGMDPFKTKLKQNLLTDVLDDSDLMLNAMNGKIFKNVPQVETGKKYMFYIDGYFRTPEIVRETWERYGKPSELIIDKINYTPNVWDKYVNSLENYLYPLVGLPIAMHEALFEGMTPAVVAYLMRKNPDFIHEVMSEFTKTLLELIKRYAEAGVEIVIYYDDLGYKRRSILSPKNFQTFILPYYKQIYQACKKRGMFIIQHSCGYIDKLLPYMVDAGLDCIQALEPAAGVDLSHLKETLGDKVAFMGGMDSSVALNFGTPQEVVEDVKKCIKAAGQGGGYFAGPSHNILNSPWENVVAMRDAILKYRNYPLKV